MKSAGYGARRDGAPRMERGSGGTRGRVRRMAAVAAFVLGAAVNGCGGDREAEGVGESKPILAWDATSETTVIALEEDAPMTGQADAPPLLRIRGDGAVQVRYRPGSAKAGDYSARMSQDAIGELLRELTALGVMEFDAGQARARMREAQAARGPEAGIPVTADAATTRLTIRLDEYAPSSDAEVVRDFVKEIEWYNLDMDAERYPEVEALGDLQRAVERLKGIAEDVRATGEI